jgi:hypothetical protein
MEAQLILFWLPSVPPPVSLWLGQTGFVALVSLFLSELSILELGPTTVLKRPSTMVVVEPVVIS